MFCGCKKRNKGKKLVPVQYETMWKKLKKKAKNDQELRRKIASDFSKLPALEAKYHGSSYKAYMRVTKDRYRTTVQDIYPLNTC